MQEKLRLLHNLFRDWRKFGLTRDQYDNGYAPEQAPKVFSSEAIKIPAKLKALYPYKPRLTEAEQADFILKRWRPMNQKVSEQIGVQRKQFFTSTAWEPDLDNI